MFVRGFCEQKFLEIKEIFNNFFTNHEETGAAFSIIQNKKKIINLYGGVTDSQNKLWDENTIVNTFSASKGIYEACAAKLFNNQLIDLEKPVSYYWPSFKQSNKSSILVKHIFSHQSGLYRFKTKLENKDLLNWKKIISILENQDPDHKPGEKTYYHAKTHGYLVGNLIKIISGLSVGQYLKKNITDKKNLNFYFGLEDSQILNVADLSLQKSGTENNTPKDENFNAFNNPEQNIEFYNSQDWRKAEIPSMGGHGNSEAIASIYDYLANDLKNDQKNIINQNILTKCLEETKPRIDLSLNFPIRWTNLGFILRGGWMFGKHKESFGHNGWGGSLGFADPINGLGISYVTKEINPTMGVDQRAATLVKKFYELLI
jgi:CubicO group peptidase (beta-lactamase class C family)